MNVSDGEGEQAAKGAGNSISDHEHVEAPLQFISWIVLAQEQHAAGNQTRFEDTDEETHGDQAAPVGDNTLADCEDT